jgi:hypothetical protein
MRYISQLIKLVYTLASMYFVLRLLELEPDSRKYALELLHVLFGSVFAIEAFKNILVDNSSVDDTMNSE